MTRRNTTTRTTRMMGRIGPGKGSIPTAHQTTLAIIKNTSKEIKISTIEFPFGLSSCHRCSML